jgi:hypothetical protein
MAAETLIVHIFNSKPHSQKKQKNADEKKNTYTEHWNLLEFIFKIMTITSCIQREFLTTQTRISFKISCSKCNAQNLYLQCVWFEFQLRHWISHPKKINDFIQVFKARRGST